MTFRRPRDEEATMKRLAEADPVEDDTRTMASDETNLAAVQEQVLARASTCPESRGDGRAPRSWRARHPRAIRMAAVAALGAVMVAPAGFAIAGNDSGEDDAMVSVADCAEAAEAFADAGFDPAAHIGGPACPTPEAVQGLVDFCPPTGCRVIDVDADSEPRSGSVGQDLSALGLEAEECPEASTAFRAAGRPVDAFIDRCPSAIELEELLIQSPAQEYGAEAMERAEEGRPLPPTPAERALEREE